MTQPKEESILPDDDAVIVSDSPPTSNITPKEKKLITINKVMSQGPPIPKIKISKGKIVLSPSLVMPSENNAVQTPSVAPATTSDTICLDSDEEETIVESTPKNRKLVAMKSTAKRTIQSTAANPANTGPPPIIPEVDLESTQVQNTGRNIVLIPAGQASILTKLPEGVIPLNPKNISRICVGPQIPAVTTQGSQNFSALNPHLDKFKSSNNVMVNQMPQTINLVNHIPQTLTSSTSCFPVQTQNINSTPVPTFSIITPTPINATGAVKRTSTTSNIIPGSIMTAGPTTQNASSSESILPTLTPTSEPKLGPASSSKPATKTFCKPGDILRITKNGQVEILNRESNDDEKGQFKPTTSMKQTKEPQTTVSLSDDDEPVISFKTGKNKSKTKKITRTRKISSSSSSSNNGSRPATPNDPLSILKDVVHIQASEDPVPAENTKSSTSSEKLIGNIVKKSASSNSFKPRTSVLKVSQAKKDKILEQINKTNTVLKKLNDVLEPPEKNAKKQIVGKVESVDLTDATPSTSKVLNKLKKDVIIGKSSKNSATTIVGTSKNIILTGNGKASVISGENM